ncbi:MAG: hypothetical protein B6D44_12540 [Ignavibacteriales bacterium UTCHB2]|nr:MAG: hypothetical protein B6D44_12540 [Ignavibacteriales bacterium UTCHB2]
MINNLKSLIRNSLRNFIMKDSIIKIEQEKLTTPLEYDYRSSFLNRGKIKSRLGFIYFVVLVSSIVILFVK